jgi:hypothetical protein
MEGTHMLKGKFGGVRSVEKPRKRWEDVVQQDAARILLSHNWKLVANDRTLWMQKIVEAKACFGMWHDWMDEDTLQFIHSLV